MNDVANIGTSDVLNDARKTVLVKISIEDSENFTRERQPANE